MVVMLGSKAIEAFYAERADCELAAKVAPLKFDTNIIAAATKTKTNNSLFIKVKTSS